jgi:hypothetical protein
MAKSDGMDENDAIVINDDGEDEIADNSNHHVITHHIPKRASPGEFGNPEPKRGCTVPT